MPLPFVVLGGIYSGKITVTEAASLTALYAIVVEVFIYRDVPWRRLPAITQQSMVLVSGILLIVATAFGLTNYLIDAEVPMRLLDWMQGAFTSKWTFLLALNVFVLVVGALLDVFSALIVVVAAHRADRRGLRREPRSPRHRVPHESGDRLLDPADGLEPVHLVPAFPSDDRGPDARRACPSWGCSCLPWQSSPTFPR